MARHRWWVLSASLILASTLGAQTVPVAPNVFSALSGEWTGEGTLFERAARFSMVWRHEDGFATLHFSNAFVDAGGGMTPVIRSAAVYRTDATRAEGVWLDSRGVQIELSWERTDSALIVTWTAPTETGRTSYRVLPSGEIKVVDEVSNGEAWRTFATAVYRRKGTP